MPRCRQLSSIQFQTVPLAGRVMMATATEVGCLNIHCETWPTIALPPPAAGWHQGPSCRCLVPCRLSYTSWTLMSKATIHGLASLNSMTIMTKWISLVSHSIIGGKRKYFVYQYYLDEGKYLMSVILL